MNVVSMKGVCKRFGAVEALSEVDLEVEEGTIHAVVGENGAGKTTLMRILYGALRADSGSIEVRGRPCSFRSASDGIAHGIGMVSQHYSIIGELSCLQNLMLGAEPGWVLKRGSARARADELAAKMGFRFDWDQPAWSLSPASAQKLEILKLLWRDSTVMILDEPTAMLSPADSDALFESLHQLTVAGATVVLVTHRLQEVIAHAQRVTVLRGGRRVSDQEVGSTDVSRLAEAIVGHALAPPAPRELTRTQQQTLEVRDLSVRGERGDVAVKSASFEVGRGEVVGIAGVDGSGQRELFWCLLGLLSAQSGQIIAEGAAWESLSTQGRLQWGLRVIPEDRLEEGVVESWPLEENAILGFQRLPPISRGPWLNRAAAAEMAERVAERFSTKHAGIQKRMSSLSGGNQQRFVAGRAFELDPKLILAFQPARGLDIDATSAVYSALHRACDGGSAALVVSFDLDELLAHCDRVLVMCGGKLTSPPPGSELDRAAIGRLMVGAG